MVIGGRRSDREKKEEGETGATWLSWAPDKGADGRNRKVALEQSERDRRR